MTRPVVFLDVDGVLNSASYLIGPGVTFAAAPDLDIKSIDPTNVAVLNRLLAAAGAEIVVSSSWQAFGLERMRQILTAVGIAAPVVGLTPELVGPRGNEIATYLRAHPYDHMVILDDDADMATLSPWLVHTSFDTGLTDADVERALAVLQRPAWPPRGLAA